MEKLVKTLRRDNRKIRKDPKLIKSHLGRDRFRTLMVWRDESLKSYVLLVGPWINSYVKVSDISYPEH